LQAFAGLVDVGGYSADGAFILERVRVLLADDHPELLAVTSRLLNGKYEVVGAVSDGQALLEAAARLTPDLIVTDISMPILSGLEAARRLNAAGSTVKVLFLTVHDDSEFVLAGLAAGAKGYVVKSRIASDLLFAVKEVLAGRSFISTAISPPTRQDRH
jgi:DNA-binding NarL/FixJ family response regulator